MMEQQTTPQTPEAPQKLEIKERVGIVEAILFVTGNAVEKKEICRALDMTDAELEETPLSTPHICDGCKECIRSCPGKAISEEGKLNNWQCAAYYNGASMENNPFMPPDAFQDLPNREAIVTGSAKLTPEEARAVIDRTFYYPPIKHGYVGSICGRACDRACYVHLERKGVLTRKFTEEFRKREPWTLPVNLE